MHTATPLSQARRVTTGYPDGREVGGESTDASFQSFTSALPVQIWF
ncbi:MAG TPA: hypothetical protein VGX50_18325 [Longimicrobium sp.]|jgi:hypothetical protein|nr:hypothetical protein [Longimicrobium sp.]